MTRIPVPKKTSPASWLVTRRHIDAFERFLPQVRGRCLDVGCGEFPYLEAMRARADEICALDFPDGHLLTRADQVPEGVKFTWADAGAIPFQPAFDTVFLFEVLEHVPHPWRVWEEIARLTAPGGLVFLTCPFHYPVHGEPHDYFRYTLHGHRRLAEEAGFDVISIEPKGGVLSLIVDINSKLALWVFRKLHLPTFWIGWYQRLFYLVFRRERFASSRYTLGYCLVARRRA